MSLDEIRTQKALALLEFKEAEDTLHSLQAQLEEMAKAFVVFGKTLTSGSDEPLSNLHNLSVEAAMELRTKLRTARQDYAAAKAKKEQFGL